MKKLLGIVVLGLLLSGNLYAHEGTHEPLVCIPESERTEAQKQSVKMSNFMHRLGKLQQDCLILKVEELEKKNKEFEKENKELEKENKELEKENKELEKENKELKKN